MLVRLTRGWPQYFAEMVKGDEHVEKIRKKLVEEASAKKASAEARKLREQKKFGKQVQIAKLQEREKAKKEGLDKIKLLKRSRPPHAPPQSASGLVMTLAC
jgi:rRNA-processing protein EBP2